jgi:hypothetical protein
VLGRNTLVALAFVSLVGLALLSPQFTRAAIDVVHNDRLHYVTHLVAGQALSLCPCTQSMAQTQLARGMYHAHTPRQVALLSKDPSQLLQGAVRYFVA